MPALLESIALLLVGGLALWFGGDKLVAAAGHLARSFRVPQAIVGAVILGFGTSSPEAVVCATAAFDGLPGVSFGVVVGSNIANVGLILGIACVLSPFTVDRSLLVMDLPLGLVAAVLMALFVTTGGTAIDTTVGLVMLVAFVGYLAISVRFALLHQQQTAEAEAPEKTPLRDLGWVLVGLSIVIVGARVFVTGAEAAATLLGVPPEVVALTVMAFGTSLPELVTTVAAARHGHPELALGNVAGSNIFNLLFVLGGGALIEPIPVSSSIQINLWIMAGFAVLAFPVLARRALLARRQGALLLTGYFAYVVWLFVQGG